MVRDNPVKTKLAAGGAAAGAMVFDFLSPGLPQITLRLDGQSEHQRGSAVALAFPQQHLHLFDENGRAVRS